MWNIILFHPYVKLFIFTISYIQNSFGLMLTFYIRIIHEEAQNGHWYTVSYIYNKKPGK